MSFAVGDRVEIINPGQTYDTYETWAKEHDAHSWVWGGAPKGGLLCTIKTLANHSRFSGDVLALVESDNGQQYIMDFKGIRKVNEETNMETLPEGKTTKELGLSLGDKFIVEDASDHSGLEKGDVATLSFDDGSICPEFKLDRTGGLYWLSLRRLRPLPEFKVGDILEHNDHRWNRKVIGVIGDVIVTEDTDDKALDAMRVDDLKAEGWHLPTPEPETKEVTLEEIAEKFGVPVEQLRVKKGDE